MDKTRVFVIDNHTMFRCGVTAMLRGEQEFEWVGEAPSGLEAVRGAPHAAPDVVLVDMTLPGLDGVATVRALRAVLPRARFVMLSGSWDAIDARRALEAGASCLLLKTASWQEMVTAMQAARRGISVHSPQVIDTLAASDPRREIGADLTKRERKLLALMACGLPNREIGDRLAIAMPTVKFHVTNILSKLNVDNRTAAVTLALRHRLVAMEMAA